MKLWKRQSPKERSAGDSFTEDRAYLAEALESRIMYSAAPIADDNPAQEVIAESQPSIDFDTLESMPGYGGASYESGLIADFTKDDTEAFDAWRANDTVDHIESIDGLNEAPRWDGDGGLATDPLFSGENIGNGLDIDRYENIDVAVGETEDGDTYLYTTTEVMVGILGSDPLSQLSQYFTTGDGANLGDLVDLSSSKTILDTGELTIVLLSLTERGNVDEMINHLELTNFIQWAEPNFVYEDIKLPEFVPNDPQFTSQYHHPSGVMNNEGAWDINGGTPNIVVAVADTGVDWDHEDLTANIWTNSGEIAGNNVDDDGNGYVDDIRGWDFYDDDNNPDEEGSDSHGTHVAGIIGAVTNNGIGIAGTAGGGATTAGVQIMPLRIFAPTASIYAEAFTYAADNGANILNLSYGIDSRVNSNTFRAGLSYMYDAGVLHINSAGNNNEQEPLRQGIHETIFVAATTSSDTRAGYSNYGYGIDVSAPGSGVLSTLPGDNYGTKSGTSMAAPNAAAVAALIWSQNPTWTRDQVAAQLLGTAEDIDALNPAYAGELGSGRVNSYLALTETIDAPKIDNTDLPPNLAVSSSLITSFSVDLGAIFDGATIADMSNWTLTSAGADGALGTADDSDITLTLDTDYHIGTNRLNFSLASALVDGTYEFRASAAGLTNPFGTGLDGDGDGVAGDDFTRTFTIDLPDFSISDVQVTETNAGTTQASFVVTLDQAVDFVSGTNGIPEVEGNDTIATAQNIDAVANWSMVTSGNITDSTSIPHISISGTGDGSYDYYAFTIGEGDRVILDIDDNTFDTEIFLFDAAGTYIDGNDDDSADPGSGSFSSYLDIPAGTLAAGTYIVGVASYSSSGADGGISGDAPAVGESYTLHVSVESHGTAPVQLTIDFTTVDGTATSGVDFTPVSGTLVFDGTANEQQIISVDISGDSDFELDETFTVNLSNIGGTATQQPVSISDAEGVGTILNDDTVSGITAVDDHAEASEDSVLNISSSGQSLTVQSGATSVLANDLQPQGSTSEVIAVQGNHSLTGASVHSAVVTANADGTFQYDPTGSAAVQALSVGETLIDTFTYTVADTSLLGRWEFAEGAGGTPTDTSGNGNSGVISGSLTYAAGRSGNADDYAIDFSSGSISIVDGDTAFDSIETTQQVSIEFWAYGDPAVQPARNSNFMLAGPSGERVAFAHVPWSNGRVYWDSGNSDIGGGRVSALLSPSDYEGQWNHYVFTKDANTGYSAIYLNGSLIGSRSDSNTPLLNPSSLTIGNAYYGMMDDFAIYDKALSAEEVGFNFQNGNLSESTVTITVTGANDAPVATNDIGYLADEDNILNISATADGILENDNDIDVDGNNPDDSLTVFSAQGTTLGGSPAIVTSALGATLTVNSNGTFTYDPTTGAVIQAMAVGESAVDSFTYVVSDGAASDTATVYITVEGRDDPATATDDSYTTHEDELLTGATSLLSNDVEIDINGSDPDDTLTILSAQGSQLVGGSASVTSANGATIIVNSNGTFSYDATSLAGYQALADGESMTDTFTYQVAVGQGGAITPQSTALFSTNGPTASEVSGLTANTVNGFTFTMDITPTAQDVAAGTKRVLFHVGNHPNGTGLYLVDGVPTFINKMGSTGANSPYSLQDARTSAPYYDPTSPFTFDDRTYDAGWHTDTNPSTLTPSNSSAPEDDAVAVQHGAGISGSGTPSTLVADRAHTISIIFDPGSPGVRNPILRFIVDGQTETFVFSGADSTNWLGDQTYSVGRTHFDGVADHLNLGALSWSGSSGGTGTRFTQYSDFDGTISSADFYNEVAPMAGDTATVTVTVVGNNDTPDITPIGASSAAITETNAAISASGNLTVLDVDTTDVVSLSASSVSVDGSSSFSGNLPLSDSDLLSMLSLSPGTVNANAPTGDTVAWNFLSGTSGDPAFDFLAAGETLVLHYQVEAVDDSSVGTISSAPDESDTASQMIAITITGTNDAPTVIAGGDVSGGLAEGAGGTLFDSGSFSMADADLSNTQTVSIIGSPSTTRDGGSGAIVGTLVPTIINNTTTDGAGSINWVFSVADADLDFLAAGQVITQTYLLRIDDQNGQSVTQAVTITLTGTNDAPVFTGDLAATISAQGNSYTITNSDLYHVDPDDSAEDITYTVSSAVNGQILLSGVPALSFSGADLANGLVSFEHDGSDTLSAAFDVMVEDGDEDSSIATAQTFSLVVADVVAPQVVAIERFSPAAPLTAADDLTFRVVFDEPIGTIGLSDFAVTGSTGIPSSLTLIAPGEYLVTVEGGDLADIEGDVGLMLSAGNQVTDLSGNLLSAVPPATSESYLLDNYGPTPIISGPSSSVADEPITLTIDFGESVSGFTIDDVDVTNGQVVALFDNGDGTYLIEVLPTEGTLIVAIASGVSTATSGLGYQNLAAVDYSADISLGVSGATTLFDVANLDLGSLMFGTKTPAIPDTDAADAPFETGASRDLSARVRVQYATENSSFIIPTRRDGSWAITVADIFSRDLDFRVDEGLAFYDPMSVLVDWIDSKGVGRSVIFEITMIAPDESETPKPGTVVGRLLAGLM